MEINLIHHSTFFLAIPNIELKDIVHIQDSKIILFQLGLSNPRTVYITVKNNECSRIDQTNINYTTCISKRNTLKFHKLRINLFRLYVFR